MEKTKSKNGEFFLLFDKGGKRPPTKHKTEESARKQMEGAKDGKRVKNLCIEKFSSNEEAEKYIRDLYERNEAGLFIIVLPKKKNGRVVTTFAYKEEEMQIRENQPVYPEKFVFGAEAKRKAEKVQEEERKDQNSTKKKDRKKLQDDLSNYAPPISKKKLKKKEFNESVKKEIAALSKNEMIAFVDGSMAGDGKGSWAVILFSKNKKEIFGSSFSAETKYGNIESELMAARKAILLAKERGATSLKIYYDSHSIPQLAEKEESKGFFYEYFKEVQDGKSEMKIELAYSPAHSGILYNEQCDKISKFLLSE